MRIIEELSPWGENKCNINPFSAGIYYAVDADMSLKSFLFDLVDKWPFPNSAL